MRMRLEECGAQEQRHEGQLPPVQLIRSAALCSFFSFLLLSTVDKCARVFFFSLLFFSFFLFFFFRGTAFSDRLFVPRYRNQEMISKLFLRYQLRTGDSNVHVYFHRRNKISNNFFFFFFFLRSFSPGGILSVPFPHFHGTSFFNGPFPALIKFRGRSPPARPSASNISYEINGTMMDTIRCR